MFEPPAASRRLGVAAAAFACGLAVADWMATAAALPAADGGLWSGAVQLAGSTRFGQARLIRALCALGLALVLELPRVRPEGGRGCGPGRLGWLGRASRGWAEQTRRQWAGRTRRGCAGALAGLGLATFAFNGHAMDVGQWAVAGAADLLHLAAAAGWAGVLAHLAVSRWPPAPPETVACVSRFSAWAMGCLAVLALTGAFAARLHLPGPAALGVTPYGQLLGLKLVLLAGALAAAGVSLFAHSLWAEQPQRVARWVGRAVRVEALLALGVVAVAGLLRSTPPPDPAAAVEARTFTWNVADGSLRLTLQPVVTDPGAPVTVHWQLQAPEVPGAAARLTLDMPGHPMVPVQVALRPAGARAAAPPGSEGSQRVQVLQGESILAMAGNWQGRLEWGGAGTPTVALGFTFSVQAPPTPPGQVRLSLVEPWRSPRRAAWLVSAGVLAAGAVWVGVRLFQRPQTRPWTPVVALPLAGAVALFGQAVLFAATPTAFERNPLPATPEVLARGAALVAQHCGPCARWLATRPPGTEGDYFWWLREGYPQGSLAARRQQLGRLVSETDLWAMVSYLRRGCPVPTPGMAGRWALGTSADRTSGMPGGRAPGMLAGPTSGTSADRTSGVPAGSTPGMLADRPVDGEPDRAACPAPDPATPLPVADALRAGPYLVAAALSPALPGDNELRLWLSDLSGQPLGGAQVRVRTRWEPALAAGAKAGKPSRLPVGAAAREGAAGWVELAEEETGVYSGTLAIPREGPQGWWTARVLVTEVVVQGPAGEGQARFAWELPVRTAAGLLRQAMQAMQQLTAVEEVQEMETGSARWRYRIRYWAPDRLFMAVFDGRGQAQLEVQVMGSLQKERRPGEPWRVRTSSGARFRWPEYGYWKELTNPLRLRTETDQGQELVVVGAYHPASNTYWRLWVQERTGYVHRLEMLGASHFMTSVFRGFEPQAPANLHGRKAGRAGQ